MSLTSKYFTEKCLEKTRFSFDSDKMLLELRDLIEQYSHHWDIKDQLTGSDSCPQFTLNHPVGRGEGCQ